MERWSTTSFFRGFFEFSSEGRVRTKIRAVRFVSKKGNEAVRIKEVRIIKTQRQNGGYLIVHLNKNGIRYARTVHSLVAEAFLGPRPKNFDVCHLNGKRRDNRLSNLKYDTRSNNFQDARAHGTYFKRITANKLSPTQVRQIRKARGLITAKVLGAHYGVHMKTISRIWCREFWKHI